MHDLTHPIPETSTPPRPGVGLDSASPCLSPASKSSRDMNSSTFVVYIIRLCNNNTYLTLLTYNNESIVIILSISTLRSMWRIGLLVGHWSLVPDFVSEVFVPNDAAHLSSEALSVDVPFPCLHLISSYSYYYILYLKEEKRKRLSFQRHEQNGSRSGHP